MQGGLFDQDDEPPVAAAAPQPVDPATCRHRDERRSVTTWPGEDFERLTMTCEACGRVRGRYPGE
jgi:hypothetical protein